MSEIKAIPTRYKGYHFRSRLEARWAVFFDALGVSWTYETEGYELGGGIRYLPDFWLPHVGAGCFVEIKPCALSDSDEEKLRLFADHPNRFAMAFCGSPWPGEFAVWEFRRKPEPAPEIATVLESVAGTDREWVANAVDWQRYYVPWFAAACARVSKYRKHYDAYSGIVRSERCIAYCRYHRYMLFGFRFDGIGVCPQCGDQHSCPSEPALWSPHACAWFRKSHAEDDEHCEEILSGEELGEAFSAARSARFEHGESGAT